MLRPPFPLWQTLKQPTFAAQVSVHLKKGLTWVFALVGHDFSISELQGLGRLLVDGVEVARLRRIGEAVRRVDAFRNEAGKLEAVLRPDPVRQTVEPLAALARHADLEREKSRVCFILSVEIVSYRRWNTRIGPNPLTRFGFGWKKTHCNISVFKNNLALPGGRLGVSSSVRPFGSECSAVTAREKCQQRQRDHLLSSISTFLINRGLVVGDRVLTVPFTITNEPPEIIFWPSDLLSDLRGQMG